MTKMTPNETRNPRRSGRKEVLTKDLALKIAKMIERMPDAAIAVTWKNVETHVKRQFGVALRRNVLSTKQWDGRKLISEAYDVAKKVQKRLLNQHTPKYATSPRAKLRQRVQQLESQVLGLKHELENTRATQYEALDLFRLTRMDLRLMVEKVHAGKGP